MKKILQKIKCFMGLHEIEVQKISRPLKTYPKDCFYDAENHCIKIRDKTGLVVEVIDDVYKVQAFLAHTTAICIYNMGDFVEHRCKICNESFKREKWLDA